MNKKVLSFGMAAVSALSAVTPALAVEQHSGDGNNVPVELTVEKPTFSVTVPTGLPVAVDAAGKVYCSTTATIKNNTFGQVKVSNVTIEGNTPWTVADWALDMQKEKVNTTKIAMQLNKGVTGASGYDFQATNFPVMDGHGSLPLTYDAKLPAQTKVISGDTVANVVFTVGWNTDGAETPAPDNKPHAKGTALSKTKLDAQAKAKTGTLTFSREKHNPVTHGAGVDISEAGDGSVMCVIAGEDVTVYGDGGVLAPNYQEVCLFSDYTASAFDLSGLDTSNMPRMRGMFQCSVATSLDLSSFDTSQVIDMHNMFWNSAATTLDLSSFDTSKVTDMFQMFAASSATTLDLSSFDMSNVTNMWSMFQGSAATTIWCSAENYEVLKNQGVTDGLSADVFQIKE